MYNNKPTDFRYQRLKSLYEREITLALQNLIKKNYLPTCSITNSLLSAKGESLKIYLLFTNSRESQSFLALLNKNYLFLIKRHLANCKKFPRIPQITFYLDKEKEKIARIESIIKRIK